MNRGELAEIVLNHCGGVDGLAGLFFEAADTERRLPKAFDLRVRAAWPEVASDPGMAYGYGEAEVRLGAASAIAIRNYDWALQITMRLDEDDSKIVWAAAHSAVKRQRGPSWSRIGRVIGLHPQTVKRRFERAILGLWYNLQNSVAKRAKIG